MVQFSRQNDFFERGTNCGSEKWFGYSRTNSCDNSYRNQITSMPVPWLMIHARSSPFSRGVCIVVGSTLYSLSLYIHRGI